MIRYTLDSVQNEVHHRQVASSHPHTRWALASISARKCFLKCLKSMVSSAHQAVGRWATYPGCKRRCQQQESLEKHITASIHTSRWPLSLPLIAADAILRNALTTVLAPLRWPLCPSATLCSREVFPEHCKHIAMQSSQPPLAYRLQGGFYSP